MTTFGLIGTRAGQVVWIDWTDGELSGDPLLVDLVKGLAKAYDGQPVSPGFTPATTTTAAHLATPTSAYALMQLCFLESRPEDVGETPMLGQDDVLVGDDAMDGPSGLPDAPR